MTEHITQEQAWELATPLFSPTLCQTIGSMYFAKFANTAIQHYKDSQPKPASVEEIMGLVDRLLEPEEGCPSRLETLAATTLAQQAEALAQALAEVERLKLESAHLQRRCERRHVRFDRELESF